MAIGLGFQRRVQYDTGMSWMDPRGYVRVWHQGREEYVHRLVVEAQIGRSLRRDEQVHHLNGRKDDNRPENLEVVDCGEHTSRHHRAGTFDARNRRLTYPDAECSACGWFGHLRGLGMCKKCYHRDYYQKNKAKWKRA